MKKILLYMMLILLIGPQAMAGQPDQAVVSPSTASWHFMLVPFAWISGLTGSVTVRGNTASLDVTPTDIINNLSKVDAIFQLHAELAKGRWALMLDTTYLKVTQEISASPRPNLTVGASFSPELLLFDVDGFYTLIQPVGFGVPHAVALQAYLGARHFRIKLAVSPLRFPTVKGEKGFTAPIIGARLSTFLTRKLQVVLRGDVGGFNVDDMHHTWGLTLTGGYYFNQSMALVLGFRMLDIDASRGSGRNRFAINSLLYGPVLGFAFRF